MIPQKLQKGSNHVLAFSRNYPHGRALRDPHYPAGNAQRVVAMMGALGTVLVIAQMAALSFGFAAEYALTFGFFAACCWIAHAIQKRDQWILYTNTAILGFAGFGLFF